MVMRRRENQDIATTNYKSRLFRRCQSVEVKYSTCIGPWILRSTMIEPGLDTVTGDPSPDGINGGPHSPLPNAPPKRA